MSDEGETLHVSHFEKDDAGVVTVEFRAESNLGDDPDFWISFRDPREIDAIIEILFSARAMLKKDIAESSAQIEMEIKNGSN